MANRITPHKAGKGDLGLSQFCNDYLLRKSHPIAGLYGEIETLQNLFSRYLDLNTQMDGYSDAFGQETTARVEVLVDVFYSINANLYSNLANPVYHLTSEVVEVIEDFCEQNNHFSQSNDFEIFTHEMLILFDAIRIQIRKIEHLFHIFIGTEPIATFSNNKPQIQSQFELLSKFLNRLSTWAYLEIKIKQAELLILNPYELKPRHWVSAMPDYDAVKEAFLGG